MGNELSNHENDHMVEIEGTGVREFETPIYRNATCTRDHDNLLVESYDDNVTTCHQAFLRTKEVYGRFPCIGVREILEDGSKGEYTWETYRSVFEKMKHLGAGLKSLGLDTDDKVGICAINRPEWIYVLQACYAYSFVSVPLFSTYGKSQFCKLLDHADVEVLICSQDKAVMLQGMERKIPKLKWVIILEEDCEDIFLKGINIVSFSHILEIGKQVSFEFCPPTPETIASICYTSGTTDDLKGVMLSHANIIASVSGILFNGLELDSTDVHLSYLPMAHSYERIIIDTFIARGAAIGMYSGDIMKLLDDTSELKPTIFASVPRVFNKLYDNILKGVKLNGGLYQNLFEKAYSRKQGRLKMKTESLILDAVVFKKMKVRFGGRIRFILCGGGPLQPIIQDFFKVILSCPVLQGYGLTETSGIVSLQGLKFHNSGWVGVPSPCTEIKLRTIPKSKFVVDATSPKGEILVRGKNIFCGYYKRPDLYDLCIDNYGWFRTGDVAQISNGSLKIIDRIKDLFKLSQGEYIEPSKIESIMSKCKYISQIFVCGDSTKSCLVAIVVPNFDTIREWAELHGMFLTNDDITESLKVKTLLLNEMTYLSNEHELIGHEIIRNIHLDEDPFTIENKLLTPTLKLKRNRLYSKYKRVIENLYEEYYKMPTQFVEGYTSTEIITSDDYSSYSE